jgi:hypothetical protein
MSSIFYNNIAIILKKFQDNLKVKYEGLHVVFTPDISYRASVVEARSFNVLKDRNEETFKLFAYNRGPLNWAITNRAGRIDTTMINIENRLDIFKSWFGSIDVSFAFFATDPKSFDEFEMMFHLESQEYNGITSLINFEVDLSKHGLGVWSYQVIWEPSLDSIDLHAEGTYHKGISGRLRILGQMILFRLDQARIDQINLSIFGNNDTTLGTEVITRGN